MKKQQYGTPSGGVSLSQLEDANAAHPSEFFETISSGTSGTLSIPAGYAISLDRFGGGVDAIILAEVDGEPDRTGSAVLDTLGEVVTTTLDSAGDFVLSGTPASYPVDIVFAARATAETAASIAALINAAAEKATPGSADRIPLVDTEGLKWVDWAYLTSAVPTGASFPASPATGDLFLHSPTGRLILWQYANAAWNPIISYGSMAIYVDPIDGVDTPDNGGAVGTSAFKTPQYAVNTIPGLVGGNVTIILAAGTYTGNIKVEGKSFSGSYGITIVGTLTELSSATADSKTTGATSAFGTITDTGAFGAAADKLLYITATGAYHLIDTVTADVATIVGYFPDNTNLGYKLYDWGSVIVGTVQVVTGQRGVTFRDVKLTGGAVTISGGVQASLYRCEVSGQPNTCVNVFSQGSASVVASLVVCSTATYAFNLGNASLSLSYSKVKGTHTNATLVAVSNNSSAMLGAYPSQMNVFDGNTGGGKAYVGVDIFSGSTVSFEATYSKIRNLTTGVRAYNGGQGTNTSNNQYSGNSVNETATAASYGYID